MDNFSQLFFIFYGNTLFYISKNFAIKKDHFQIRKLSFFIKFYNTNVAIIINISQINITGNPMTNLALLVL